jgi:hypothetical protein
MSTVGFEPIISAGDGAADPSLRQSGYWDRLWEFYRQENTLNTKR